MSTFATSTTTEGNLKIRGREHITIPFQKPGPQQPALVHLKRRRIANIVMSNGLYVTTSRDVEETTLIPSTVS